MLGRTLPVSFAKLCFLPILSPSSQSLPSPIYLLLHFGPSLSISHSSVVEREEQEASAPWAQASCGAWVKLEFLIESKCNENPDSSSLILSVVVRR